MNDLSKIITTDFIKYHGVDKIINVNNEKINSFIDIIVLRSWGNEFAYSELCNDSSCCTKTYKICREKIDSMLYFSKKYNIEFCFYVYFLKNDALVIWDISKSYNSFIVNGDNYELPIKYALNIREIGYVSKNSPFHDFYKNKRII